jgi:hypothetical protein
MASFLKSCLNFLTPTMILSFEHDIIKVLRMGRLWPYHKMLDYHEEKCVWYKHSSL